MDRMRVVRDKYSEVGAAAWRHWAELCAIDRCSKSEQGPLRDFVCSAIRGQIGRIPDVDIKMGDFTDDVVAHDFDVYMLVGGNMNNSKPHKNLLKSEFDISCDGSLKEMVCGKIFSHKCGLVKDIARKTIEDVYGWAIHTPKNDEGHRAPIFEKPLRPINDKEGNELEPPLPPVKEKRSGTDWVCFARGIIAAIGGKTPMEGALLAYAICENMNKGHPVLQKYLGVGAVQTNKKYHAAMQAILIYMKKHGLTVADVEIVDAIRKEAGQRIGAVVRKELGE